ncbi:MAG TPA: YjfB family protein [Paucimonas sp.]|nr:YjfB family protein [Paucimonas sp.]
MEVGSIASIATRMSEERTSQAIGIAVLKKALDAERASAAVLLQAVAQTPAAGSANLPSHLGQNINIVA